MEHISFVILHYMSYEYTRDCIDSILTNITYRNYSIVIVDNHSPNNSATLLKERYANNPNVILLFSETNAGFAKGNNLGYHYAKHILNSKFIIAANNDIQITQFDFLIEVISLFKQYNYHLAGPDILTIDGKHQNPYRPLVINYSAARKWLRNRQLWTMYLRVDKLLGLRNKFTFAQKFHKKRELHNNAHMYPDKLQTHVVLQGACIIFSPLYVKQMDYAFLPDTYMYCEEDILAYQCQQKNWLILYSPSLQILHAECASTKELHQKSIDKEIFQSSNIVKSLKILLKLMKE